ncbi:hypothetical protein RFM98_30385 [Mesorhizobium sp. VK9D]|nr:hypothetical protein [Mesorhizobium sp. VK9D]MDX8457048.1 hypothetical protein [Mesorhizobium sp. VK9D]
MIRFAREEGSAKTTWIRKLTEKKACEGRGGCALIAGRIAASACKFQMVPGTYGRFPVLAMALLHHGVDRSVIVLWLGHESVETTAIYLQADMKLREQALAKTEATDILVLLSRSCSR